MSNRTIPRIFEDSVRKYKKNILMWEKAGDQYEGTTYEEMQMMVHQFAAGLISLGINHGDRISLISEGRNDWVMSELGILFSRIDYLYTAEGKDICNPQNMTIISRID